MDKRFLVLGWAVAAACLAGCASNKQKMTDADLERIDRWLPGTYDNTLQAKTDAEKGVRPPHEAVELAIVPVESVSVGRHAFYIQEMAADNPLRVLSQRVVVFTLTDKGIIETVSSLNDPLQWRDGQRNPDMFEAMTPRDFKPAVGCELTWKREEKEGAAPAKKLTKEEMKKALERTRFIGINDMKRCQTTSHAVIGLIQLELRGELSATEFATAETQYDPDGKLILGNKDEPFYRFRKVGK